MKVEISPGVVVIDGEVYVPVNGAAALQMDILVAFYRASPRQAAALCDEVLDTTGELLGRLRDESARRR